MKKYKIAIIFVIIILITVGVFTALPPTMSVILCDDKILNLDSCGDYLEEKYSKLSSVKHFREMYPDPPGLGFKSNMFQAVSVIATSSMEEKQVAELEINLKNSSITYRCYDLNFSDDNSITVHITNPTTDDMDGNYCLG